MWAPRLSGALECSKVDSFMVHTCSPETPSKLGPFFYFSFHFLQ